MWMTGALNNETSHPPGPTAARCAPHLAPHDTRPGVTACSTVPHPQVMVSACQSPSIKSGRGDCFFKCVDIYAKATKITKKQGKWHHKRTKELTVTEPKEIEIHKLPNKESNRYSRDVQRATENRDKHFNEIKRYKMKLEVQQGERKHKK